MTDQLHFMNGKHVRAQPINGETIQGDLRTMQRDDRWVYIGDHMVQVAHLAWIGPYDPTQDPFA